MVHVEANCQHRVWWFYLFANECRERFTLDNVSAVFKVSKRTFRLRILWLCWFCWLIWSLQHEMAFNSMSSSSLVVEVASTDKEDAYDLPTMSCTNRWWTQWKTMQPNLAALQVIFPHSWSCVKQIFPVCWNLRPKYGTIHLFYYKLCCSLAIVFPAYLTLHFRH